jgi:hypothetical protein
LAQIPGYPPKVYKIVFNPLILKNVVKQFPPKQITLSKLPNTFNSSKFEAPEIFDTLLDPKFLQYSVYNGKFTRIPI